MTKQEVIQIITLLAGNYDSIARKDIKQKELMVSTWYECLKDLDYNITLEAVKRVIITQEYPPNIHEIRKSYIDIITPNQEQTSLDAWNEAYSMICNGIYMTQEEFDKHSREVKLFFGNIKQVKELAQTDIKTIHTVVKGQFLKQYEIIQERNNQQKLLPDVIKQIQEKTIKQIE